MRIVRGMTTPQPDRDPAAAHDGGPPGAGPDGGRPAGAGPPPAYGPPSSYAPSPGYGPPPGYSPSPPSDQTLWALLSHLSIFVFSLIGPLVIYLVYRDTAPFVRQHAAEALNFHLTLAIAGIVSFVLVFVLVGIPLLIAVLLFGWVMGIIAAIAAWRGQPYRYPLTIHFVH